MLDLLKEKPTDESKTLERLHLMPLEELKKKIPLKIKSASLEIMMPTEKKALEELVYSLIKKGITKSKLYLIRASRETFANISATKDNYLQFFWTKLQSLFKYSSPDDNTEDVLDNCSIFEPVDSDYTIITKKGEGKPILDEKISIWSNSLSFSNNIKLKSVNSLQAMHLEDSLATSYYGPAFSEYNHSFYLLDECRLSNGSLEYAPHLSPEELKEIQFNNLQFELIGNEGLVQDLDEIFKYEQ